MIDIFGNIPINLDKIVCHSGGAYGSDSFWEEEGANYGVKTRAYSYKTKTHKSPNRIEISDSDYDEGVKEITKANKTLNRFGIHKYMNLLARNWAQVKYSDEIFAIGTIVKSGSKNEKGYYNKSKFDVVDGGTGYAVGMAINNNKPVYVFDQIQDKWFRWSYTSLKFVEMKKEVSITSQNFAGIGTREIKPNGIQAIKDVYKITFNQK
jgi:hypothetical protein